MPDVYVFPLPNDFYIHPNSNQQITWYLALRGIPYAECLQPPYLPRPDLNKLGIQYRRIPLLSIGRSVYCDTRLILAKLEELFPSYPSLNVSQDPAQIATQKLLESWTVDGGVFVRASQTIPPDLPLMKDPKFMKDREDFSGRPWNPDAVRASRPEALCHLREAFDFLETGFLADGRTWILATDKPSLADIHAVWPFHWMTGMKGALPEDIISAKTYPKVFAYIQRFNNAVRAAKENLPKPTRIKGQEAVDFIMHAKYPEGDQRLYIDDHDPVGANLKLGQVVGSWPIDSGFKHKDVGKLVKLDKEEIVLEVEGQGGKLRLHHPRWNFRVKATADGVKL